ncbi:MAG: sensor domain-containing protein [Ilumatobacter sp.]|uniref:sensor domain-containing protein n=1 Tax=Ilumatobacter sp. TaxID=1967498 RepID=UPI0026113D40|nr:sensor domain-containing protein [Ilumatobacter sp.]MDJ0770112.1 sensor domain-containing protein [Ilumatobacter sp.]
MREALRGTWYLLVTAVVGIAWASCLVSLLAAGIGLLVVVVGVFVLIATADLIRWIDDAEVVRAARYLRTERPTGRPSEHDARPEPVALPDRLRRAWASGMTQRAFKGIVRMVTGPALLSVTITLWLVPLGLVATPIMTATGLEPTEWTEHVDSIANVGEWPAAIGMTFVGLMLAPVAAVALRSLATAVAERVLAVTA